MNSGQVRMPVLFTTQGYPPLLESPKWRQVLSAWGQALPRPRAILVVSAHWVCDGLVLGSVETPIPLYMGNEELPKRFHQLNWSAPPALELAQRVSRLLGAVKRQERGLDYGAFVPLMMMFPEHDIPVLQLAQPSLNPKRLWQLGRQLAPLRDEGVLILTSGSITHQGYGLLANSTPISTFMEFDQWVAEALLRGDVKSLLDYERRAPHHEIVLPSREHLGPLFVALGAADDVTSVEFPTSGFWYGSSMRSITLF
jgi:4,5-DOPA dioxygenase extradiol